MININITSKLTSSIIMFLMVFNLYGQGSLQFNRVISATVTGTANPVPELNGTVIGSIVVPPGKVLKLESVSVYTNDPTGDLETHSVDAGTARQFDTGCWIGNHLVWAPFVQTTVGDENYSKFVQTSTFPIWFNPNTHEILVRFNSNMGVFGRFAVVTYSAIEFNVIP